MLLNKEEIANAKKNLESTHNFGAILPQLNTFFYLKSSQNGRFKRYHFYKGLCRGIIYVYICEEEQKQIEKHVHKSLGDNFTYFDSVLLGESDTTVHHRFYLKDKPPNNFIMVNDDWSIFKSTNDQFNGLE